MIIPIRTDYRLTARPWVNYAIIAANVLLFVLGFNGDSMRNAQRMNMWLLHPDSPELFQFFSAVFLHAGWTHLIGNMLFLWVFGNAVNDRFGHLGYLMFYLAGGVLSGVGYVLLSGTAPVLGASGAIAAVTGAYLVLLPRANVTVLVLIYLIFTYEISSLYFLLFQFVINLWMSLSPAITGRSAGGVAYAAHASGYVFGIVVAAALLAIRALPRDPFDLLNLLRTSQRRHSYRRMVAQGYDPFSHVRPQMRDPQRRWVDAKTVPPPPASAEARELELRKDITDYLTHGDLSGAASKYLQLLQIADDAILPRQQQLDIANQLMAQEQHPAAADAYERFLRHYGANYEHVADIYLMLGLLYGRYLQQYDSAQRYLQLAVENLHDLRKLELARGDLQALAQRRKG